MALILPTNADAFHKKGENKTSASLLPIAVLVNSQFNLLMLTHLTISRFAIVDYLELDFTSGMSVITGETGAGKSIMLDALSLTLGDRAESGQIGPGQDKAEITTEFHIANNADAKSWLKERDLLNEDLSGSNLCMLRRVLNADGRSRGYINGSPVTVQEMKQLGNMLIDVHSQHEHQSLLKKETHRRLLDEFAGLTVDVSELNEIFLEYKGIRLELQSLIGDNTDQSAKLQLLTYQAEELSEVAIEEGEHLKLEAEHKRLANAEKSMQQANESLSLLAEGDLNSKDLLAQAIQLLTVIDDDTLDPTKELLSSSLIQMQEATQDLKHLIDSFEMDPQKLLAVESRLGKIYEIARKHHVTPEKMPSIEARITEELEKLMNLGTHIEALNSRLEILSKAYTGKAQALHSKRSAAAKNLQRKVEDQLGCLGMNDTRFVIRVVTDDGKEPRLDGLDNVEFLISTNPGQEPAALNRIASGGELSRISLAIQVVTANTSRVPTLVFDEVDVGVSGAIAEVVGNLLRQLGDQAQIVCVTHLPQVAAQGHHHYQIIKEKNDLRSQTLVTKLDEKEKVSEIARMLGGISITDQSLAHAEEMFKMAQQ